MKSFEALVVRLCEAALAGNIHHQHSLARVIRKIDLTYKVFKFGIVNNDHTFTLCPRWSAADRSKKSSTACDITVLIKTKTTVFRNILSEEEVYILFGIPFRR